MQRHVQNMKNIFESRETFEAYAVIDCCYYMLQDMQKNLAKPHVQDVAHLKHNKE